MRQSLRNFRILIRGRLGYDTAELARLCQGRLRRKRPAEALRDIITELPVDSR